MLKIFVLPFCFILFFSNFIYSHKILKFIEMKSYQEISFLPPRLEVNFDLLCNQTFFDLIRYETADDNGKVTVFIGGLVEEDLLNECNMFEPSNEITKFAGFTFSGRDYQIESIKF